jgi:hypothetical protein
MGYSAAVACVLLGIIVSAGRKARDRIPALTMTASY